jgi:hypothetical protein
MAKDFNPALGRMVGYGGDVFINASTSSLSGIVFSHVFITSDAVLTDIKIGGTSVLTARNYVGHTLPAGYLICAGGDDTIDYVMLASGSAEGVIFSV